MTSRRPVDTSHSRGDHDRGQRVASETQPAPLYRNASFLLLWAGQFVSQMGDRLRRSPSPGWCTRRRVPPWARAPSSRSTPALAPLRGFLRGHRRPGRQALADDRIDVLRAALVLAVPLLVTRSLPSVFVLTFVIATAGVFFEPAKLAMLPEIVTPGRLMRANSLFSTGENLTEILGWAFAGALLAAVSTTSAFRLDAATFGLSGGAAAHALPGARARGGGAALRARSGRN